MSEDRLFWAMIISFVAGWALASLLIFYDAPLWLIILVLLGALLAIAKAAGDGQ